MEALTASFQTECYTSILIYGRDSILLATREMILRAAGYRVWIATNLSDVGLIFSQETIELLLICHTVATADCLRSVGLARASNVTPLILTAGSSACGAPGLDGIMDVEETLDVMDGPAKLVATVASLARHVRDVSGQLAMG